VGRRRRVRPGGGRHAHDPRPRRALRDERPPRQPAGGVWFGSSFALLGFLAGYVVEGRRRDRRQAEVIRAQSEAIAATRARLAQTEKLAALGQLAAAVAHEVRSPLAVIRSAAQGLAESVPRDDEAGRRAYSFIT